MVSRDVGNELLIDAAQHTRSLRNSFRNNGDILKQTTTTTASLQIVPTLLVSRLSPNSTWPASCNKGKAVPLQAWTGPEGSRKLRLQDFVTTAQDSGRLSALRTGRLYPQEIFLVLISVRG